MRNGKNFIKSVILTFIIIIGFIILFDILGAKQEEMGILVATIVVFTMLYCTYSIYKCDLLYSGKASDYIIKATVL